MLFNFVAVALAVVPSALAAVTITQPNSNQYWVQNTSNVISWSGYSSGDPNPITITVTNANNASLNGAFAIAQNVDLSKGFFTVTNVTLRPVSGYVVNFVNPKNETSVIASSPTFDVKAPGTPQASGATPTAAALPSATATSPAANNTTAGNSTSTAPKSSGAQMSTGPMVGASMLFGVLGAMMTI